MSAPNTRIYDAKEVSLVFFAFLIDSGYDEGEFCTVEIDGDDVSDKAGADGEVTRSKTNEARVTITITLMQTSEGNSKLTAISMLDRSAPNGAGVGPFFIRDKSGTSLHAGTCWIAARPKVTYGKEASNRVWKLRGVLEMAFDGNS